MNKMFGSARARWITVTCLAVAVLAAAALIALGRTEPSPEAAGAQDPPTATATPPRHAPSAPPEASPDITEDAAADPAPTPEPISETDPVPEAPAEFPAPVDPGATQAAPDADLAAVDQPVAPPAAIDEPKEQDGIEAVVTGLESVVGEAEGIGQIGGPAVRFRINVTNNMSAALDLTDALVTVEAGPDGEPAAELIGPGAVLFPEFVSPGGQATATYVFSVAPELRSKILIHLNYSAAAPILAFAGPAPV